MIQPSLQEAGKCRRHETPLLCLSTVSFLLCERTEKKIVQTFSETSFDFFKLPIPSYEKILKKILNSSLIGLKRKCVDGYRAVFQTPNVLGGVF